jgi:predicted nucleic acid-binding protein
MSVFVDTGVFYADHDEAATRHETADTAMDSVYQSELGQPYTSDYVYDETTTLTLQRTGSTDAAKTVGRRIRGAGEFHAAFSMERVTAPLFQRAVDLFERYDDQHLSFTDATTVALVQRHDIDAVLSFDDDFDGIVDRIDPADLAGDGEHNP